MSGVWSRQFDIAAKKGDIEREQTEYEDLP